MTHNKNKSRNIKMFYEQLEIQLKRGKSGKSVSIVLSWL